MHHLSMRAGLLSLAGVQLTIGLWQAISPRSFYTALADFGPRDDHVMRDVASYYLASGVVLAIAAGRPSWRAPALALVGLQFGLHALNHLADVGKSDPSWVGPFDLLSLLAGTLLIALLFRAADREDAS
jgi:hypothetical protein